MVERLNEVLETAQLLVVMGKGGVGKSTVTAALGRLLASTGHRVLLVEIDPRENLHQLLDVEPSDGAVVRAGPNLELQHLHPRRVLDDLVAERLKFGPLARRVLASPVYQHFAEGAPGLKEAAVLGRILRLLEGHGPKGQEVPDVVILDGPASGHGVPLLAAPQLISSVIDSGPIGQMAQDIECFVKDAHRSAFVLVSLAEEMPIQETFELIDLMEYQLSREPACLVVNGLYPPVEKGIPYPSGDSPEGRADSLWRARSQINQEQLERLALRWRGPLLKTPLVAVDRGPVLIELISQTIETQLETH